ncbi:MAG: cytochrome c [Pseudomonadota bacterium]
MKLGAPALAFTLALAGCSPPPDPAALARLEGGDVERGRSLLSHYQCGSCHVIPHVPAAAGRAAPSLAGFARRSYIAGQVPNTPPNLVRWLQDPQALLPQARMPDMGVHEADARDMAAALLAQP